MTMGEPVTLFDSSAVVTPMTGGIREGDLALLVFERRRKGAKKYLVRIEDKVFHTHLGPLDLGEIIGRPWGCSVEVKKGVARVFRPSTADIMEKFSRRTQIIYPKDAAYMIVKAGVRPGDLVVEGGTGSGSLAYALSLAVGPTGRVVSYEINPRFHELAKENLMRLGVQNVELKLGDLRTDITERNADAMFLDMAAPWEVVPAAREVLKPGSPLAVFVPSCEQIKRFVLAATEGGFGHVEVAEVLVRGYEVNEQRTRPSARMVAHTGFVITARKLAD